MINTLQLIQETTAGRSSAPQTRRPRSVPRSVSEQRREKRAVDGGKTPYGKARQWRFHQEKIGFNLS